VLGSISLLGVKVEISRYVDDAQPGVVECLLVDACGHHHLFVERVPVVASEALGANSFFPQAGIIACQIVERKYVDGREIVKVKTETPWHIESTAGETSFDILPDQLIEFD
jgi:hypothetical protein